MKGLNDLIGKRVALVDRNAILDNGRVIYPTATGTLVGATEKILVMQMAEDQQPLLFFIDALRAIQDVSDEVPKKQGET